MGFSACHWLKKDQRCNSSLLLVLLLLLLPSLRLRLMLMLLFSMELMAMVDMLPPILEYMVAVTLARGLLMLSPRLMLMPTMVPMDTLDILDLLDILDTVPMVPILMLVLMAATTLAR